MKRKKLPEEEDFEVDHGQWEDETVGEKTVGKKSKAN